MKKVVLDANCVLRFILDEKPKSLEVEKLLRKNDVLIWLPGVVFAEVVWVLSSVYEIPKLQICDKLESFLLIESVKYDKNLLLNALSIFRENNISFVDSYIASFTLAEDAKLYTFDKDFKKIDGFKSHLL